LEKNQRKTTKNVVSAIRAETLNFFDETQYKEGSEVNDPSPSGSHVLKFTSYKQSDASINLCVAKARNLENSKHYSKTSSPGD